MTATRIIPLIFLALILAVPVAQWPADSRAGRSSLLRRLVSEKPTAASLQAIQDDVSDRSVTLATLRPVSQWLQFKLLGDAGSKVVRGRDGWLFYRPAIEAAVLRGKSLNPLAAIRDYHDALAERGIQLLVVPVPNKESIYPDELIPDSSIPHRRQELDKLFAGLRAAGIDSVDLRETLAAARAAGNDSQSPLYLRQDTHWSPSGLALAARKIAAAARSKLPPIASRHYTTRTVTLARHGDLLEMLRAPRLLQDFAPESITATQVLDADGHPVQSDPSADVLLMGDSFLRIFERDAPGSAGLPTHLARELGRPVTSLIADGGASTLVRQDLHGHPEWLRGKRLVIWEFVERDLRLGTEGWQSVPLPPL